MQRVAVRSRVMILALFTACKAYDASLLDAKVNTEVVTQKCSWQVDVCNGLDDDCDGIIDEQGSASCAAEHAEARCMFGACAIAACEDGFADCNARANDGCEHRVSDAHCGPCDDACDAASGQASHDEPPAKRDAAVTDEPEGLDAGSSAPHSEGDDAGGEACDESERCDGRDNDCDGKVDEGPVCACAAKHPTGEGDACDRCVCEHCSGLLDRCVATDNAGWNSSCTAYLGCIGEHLPLGECPESDCVQSGRGPCASTFYETVTRVGPSCATDPVVAPCGAVRQLRTQCYLVTCAADCKG
jgi:hypothetical protein